MTGKAILPEDSVFLASTLPAKRARYYSQENNPDFAWPLGVVHQFKNVRNLGMQSGRLKGRRLLDLQGVVELSYSAAISTLLPRYLNSHGKDSLTKQFVVSGVVGCPIYGQNTTTDNVESFISEFLTF